MTGAGDHMALAGCPFCGGEAERCSNQRHKMRWILCKKCHACPGDRPTWAEAITAWNTRAQSGVIGEMREAIQPFVTFIRAFDAKPLRSVDDEFYGIHSGTEWQATLRLSDMRRLSAILAKLGQRS